MKVNTFYDVVSLAYLLMGESRADPSKSEETVKHLVNEGYEYLCNLRNWSFLERETRLVFDNTALGASASDGNTDITVVDNSIFSVGQKIMIYAGPEEFDLGRIIAKTGSTGITLDEALEYDYDSGASVFAASQFLPWDLKAVNRVFLRKDPGGKFGSVVLGSFTLKDFIDEHTSLNLVGAQPERWLLDDMDWTRFPLSGGVWTSTEGTEWSLSCSSITEDEDFSGFMLINTDRNTGARISSYYPSTKTFQLAINIEDQASGDEFYIIRKRFGLSLYPVPQQKTSVRVLYYQNALSLVRDCDYLVLPDSFCNLPAYYAAAHLLAKNDNDLAEAQKKIEVYNDGIRRMFRELKFKVDKKLEIKPERNFFG